MSFDFIELIAVISVFQLLLLALFLVLYRKGRPSSNKLLAAFLVFNALSIVEFLLYRFRESIAPILPHIYFIGSLFVFLWGPCLYFFTRSLCTKNFRFRKKDLLHALPFLIFVIYTIFDFHLRSAEYKRQLLASGYVMEYAEKMVIYGALHLQILTYLFFSFLTLGRFKRESKAFYSSLDRIKLSWLNFILIGFSGLWIIDIVYFFLWRTRFEYFAPVLDIISLGLTIIFVNILVFKGLNAPEVLSGIEERQARQNNKRSSLSEQERKRHLETLSFYMETHKPYLEPELTVIELAEGSGLPLRLLSQTINESLNKNFFDFINSYRVEEFKKLLLEPAARQKTILQILFEAGFNSKASFNRAFKKHTGMTPSQFKRLGKPGELKGEKYLH